MKGNSCDSGKDRGLKGEGGGGGGGGRNEEVVVFFSFNACLTCSSSLPKANEVIKWCGHLKLKINVSNTCTDMRPFRELIGQKSCDLAVIGVYFSHQSQPVQVVGYLSVKAESEESFT